MESHSDVIENLGGYLKLADALGLPKGTVSAMKSRNSIPPEHWPAVASEAQKQGSSKITVEMLAELRSPRQKRAPASTPEAT